MLVTAVPAANADDGCMPRLDPNYVVGDLVDCAAEATKYIAIDWPPK